MTSIPTDDVDGTSMVSPVTSSMYEPLMASSGIRPKMRLLANRATRPTVFPNTPLATRSAAMTTFCFFETVFLADASSIPGRSISRIRLSSSRLTIPCVTAPMTFRVGQGLVTCLNCGHSAPVICVAVWNNLVCVSRFKTLEDWSFSKIESQPPPAPPPPEICPPFSSASEPRPSRGPPFQDQYTPDLEHLGSCATWKRRCPASCSPTNPPVMNFMKVGKYVRNHARFSRNNGDSAIQPGYMLLKLIPVNL
mmetsp:Transcript_11932/g.28672  ORF Transcript_11932/g.28672 Transcript_11932/m.28672 type:complete len:251 (+) Transcript_11932:304-1056(+)